MCDYLVKLTELKLRPMMMEEEGERKIFVVGWCEVLQGCTF